MSCGNLPRDEQAQAEVSTLIRGTVRAKGRERAVDLLLRHGRAAVLVVYADYGQCVLGPECDSDRSPGLSMVNSVVNEVAEELGQAHRVPAPGDGARWPVKLEACVGVGELCLVEDSRDQGAELYTDDWIHVQQPWFDGPRIRAYVERVHPRRSADILDGFEGCWGVEPTDGSVFSLRRLEAARAAAPISTEQHSGCLASLARVGEAGAPHEIQVALRSLRAGQEQLFFSGRNPLGPGDDARSFVAREEGMAEILLAELGRSQQGPPVVLWSHNTHVATRPRGDRFPNMGQFLDSALGARYVPVGLLGYEVTYRWSGAEPSTETHDEGIEAVLHSLGAPRLFVIPGQGDPRVMRRSGGASDPAEQFRALLYIDVVRPMHPLRPTRADPHRPTHAPRPQTFAGRAPRR